MCRFTAKLGRDFAKAIGGTAVIKKQYFPEPKVQNIEKQRLLFAHVAVNIIINDKEEDLMDAILLQSPGASSEILNKTMSIKYGVPLPKMGTLFIDTATVVKKTLVGEGYNAWRNPIKSTHPKHPKNYQKKGLKNINRLLLMGQILEKQKKYKSVLNDVKLLNSTIKRTSLSVKAKLAIGKTIGESMNARLKDI
jgi:ribonucleotide reductase alpha subunit